MPGGAALLMSGVNELSKPRWQGRLPSFERSDPAQLPDWGFLGGVFIERLPFSTTTEYVLTLALPDGRFSLETDPLRSLCLGDRTVPPGNVCLPELRNPLKFIAIPRVLVEERRLIEQFETFPTPQNANMSTAAHRWNSTCEALHAGLGVDKQLH